MLSRFPAIAFHAGTRWAPTPAASWPEVLAYARRKGASFLALDAGEAKAAAPAGIPDGPDAGARTLEYLTTVDDGAGPVSDLSFSLT